ncbi:MAG: beta-ketoacyl synthase N-terminal-like domain-containing protein [Candidatus Ratteibacteria bacterium]|jgi:3-oxoacyl-[acyl-carrier-protein] synthase II
MSGVKTVVTGGDIVTGYGWGLALCWQGLLDGNTAIKPIKRFETETFQCGNAATIEGIDLNPDKSLVMQMLSPLFRQTGVTIPEDAFLILAVTNGEIDFLERSILYGDKDISASRLDLLLEKVKKLIGLKSGGTIISSACVSSSAAIALGASMIKSGSRDCVLVVACDSVTEFVFSGFSALMALDKDKAKPFDKNRNGLSLGEAAGFVLLMSRQRAEKEARPKIGEVIGWGLTNDANHMTGPSRDGSGLAAAIDKALKLAEISSGLIGSICAHGTGTVYNDSMEMKAFKAVFGKKPVPTYSIKGGTGHALASAGLVETLISLKSLEQNVIPPTVNLSVVDEEAKGWVFPETRNSENGISLSTNSGFGGVNTALVLKK